MDDFEDNSNNSDHWNQKYSNWEQECIEYVESSPDMESQIEDEKGGCSHKLWISFQNAACCVAQLYKDREQRSSLWLPFQNAASSVTSLYKDCIESQRRFIEMGFQGGVHRRNKELLAWAKKRKRHIRREELIAFLSGRNPPSSFAHHHHHYHNHHRSTSWSSPKQRLVLPEAGFVASGGRTPPHHGITLTRLTLTDPLDSTSPANIDTNAARTTEEGDLETFREALALSGIRSSPQHGSNSSSRRNTVSRLSNSYAELNAFITEEFNRHVESNKRSASSSDVQMDSPTHKRSKIV